MNNKEYFEKVIKPGLISMAMNDKLSMDLNDMVQDYMQKRGLRNDNQEPAVTPATLFKEVLKNDYRYNISSNK